MLEIYCSGTPHEIGLRYGREAKTPISRSIEFYAEQFKTSAKLDWPHVQHTALEFEPVIKRKWPAYLEEMRGIAEGSGRALSDILAINVRTEITFGLFSDGCTALSWVNDRNSFLAQNWDWMEQQKANLVMLSIQQAGKPHIKMITEAGLIGKIGLNSSGVGVCLNAIRAKGMDPTKIPCHLGLRLVLESTSREEAVRQLEKVGVASSCHMLIADASGGVGMEWSSVEGNKLAMNEHGQVFHSNHYLNKHNEVEAPTWLEDSGFRVGRIEELAKGLGLEPSMESVSGLLKDTKNAPAAICRSQEGRSTAATLFSIVMDLKDKRANVLIGKPSNPEEELTLSF